jgi:K+ transporter
MILSATHRQRIAKCLLSLGLAIVGGSKLLLPFGPSEEVGFALAPALLAAIGCLEVGVSCLLLSRNWRIGAWLAMGLSIAFALGLIVFLLTGTEAADCGCFGRVRVSIEAHFMVLAGMTLLSWILLQGNRVGENPSASDNAP